MVEIAKTVFSKKGHTLKYIQLPWKRAILLARQGKIDGVIGAFHGDAPDFIFPQNEQAILANSYFSLKTSNFIIKDISSLQRLTLGIVDGYDYGAELKDYIEQAPKGKVVPITGESNLATRLMSLLELQRVDVIVEADLVFMYQMKKTKKAELFKFIGNVSEPMKAYIAFSPNGTKSLEYAKILSDGMEEIKHSGELDIIMEKYLGKHNNTK